MYIYAFVCTAQNPSNKDMCAHNKDYQTMLCREELTFRKMRTAVRTYRIKKGENMHQNAKNGV